MSDHNTATETYLTYSEMTAEWDNMELKHAGHYTLSRQHQVLNLTDSTLSAQYRDGLVFNMPPQVATSAHVGPGILVRLTYEVGRGVEVCASNVPNAHVADRYSDITAIQKALQHTPESRNQNRRFFVDYFIPSWKIRELGGTFYLSQVDLLISTLDGNMMPPHPASRLAKHIAEREAVEEQKSLDGFYYRLRIIDKTRTHGTYFVNINGSAYSIKTEVDEELKSGIYHYVPQSSVNDTANNKLVRSEYLTIEEGIKEYGLYKTREEAITHGNSKEVFEAKLLRQKQEHKEREMENEKERQAMAQEIAQMKAYQEKAMLELKNRHAVEDELRENRIAALKEDRDFLKDRLEERQLYRKDHFENRSQTRKDTSEIVKFIPVALTAVAGVVGFFVGGRVK